MPIGLSALRDEDAVREPWRCDSCGLLVFNIDSSGYPAPGAPSSYFGGEYGGTRYEKVCTACYQMKDVLANGVDGVGKPEYWRSVQNKSDLIKVARLKRNQEGGGGGTVA